MKRVRTWTALLLTAVLLLGLLSTAALAEESGVAEVKNFTEFKTALENDEVEEIRITGEVTVTEGTAQQPFEAGKPVTVALNGKLCLAQNAVMSSSVPAGQFRYDTDVGASLPDRVAEGMAAFLMWEKDGGAYRLLLGSQPGNLTEVLESSSHGSLTMAVLKGSVTLDGGVTANEFYVIDGDLTIPEGSKLTIGDFLWAGGDINDPGEGLVAKGFACGRNYNHPHLTYRWDGEDMNNVEPNRYLAMTPYDEHEIIFLAYEYNERTQKWGYRELGADDLRVTSPLSYQADAENHGGKLTLKAENAQWNRTYTIKTKDNLYSIEVHIELPDVGFYSAPDAKEENFINKWEYNPLSDNKFYVCVNQIVFDDEWKVSVFDLDAVRYDDNGNGTQVSGVFQSRKVKDGVWEITASGCGLNAEVSVTFGRDDGDESYDTGAGLWIEPVERLVYSGAPLTGSETDWGILWQDGFKSSLRDTLSLRSGASADVRLYLLVYHDERDAAENSMTAGWYCEDVHFNQIRTEGVSAVQTDEEDGRAIRVTAQSAGTHKVIRLQEKPNENGEYEVAPGTTRGVPLTVTVTSSSSSGSSGGSSGSSSGSSSGGSSSSGSSGSAPTYSVSAPTQVTGGTVKVTPTSAQKGQRVTITLKAVSGYTLEKLSVTDSKGSELALTNQGGGVYTFTMPAGKVTVTPVFQSDAAQKSDTPETSAAFQDVASTAYYYDAVQWAVSKGITSGTTANTFSPDASCSRAQTVTFLWRAAGSPVPESTANPFTDVSSNAYYYNAVLWAVEQGITSGTSDRTFSPDAVVTRGQTVTFLYRAAKSPAVSSGSVFGDVTSDAYYANAVQWAVERGITGGTGGGLFSPGTDCTRAQIVTFLYRGNGN